MVKKKYYLCIFDDNSTLVTEFRPSLKMGYFAVVECDSLEEADGLAEDTSNCKSALQRWKTLCIPCKNTKIRT